FDKFDPQLQIIIRQTITSDSNDYKYVIQSLEKNPKLNIYSERNKDFRKLVSSFQNKSLLTLGVHDTSYTNGQLFKSMNISLEYLKGIIHPYRHGNIDSLSSANLEVDIKVAGNFTDDTLKANKNLNRQIFNIEPGINLVLKGKKSQQPYLEFKVSGSYINIR